MAKEGGGEDRKDILFVLTLQKFDFMYNRIIHRAKTFFSRNKDAQFHTE